jgi:hypothetical protein
MIYIDKVTKKSDLENHDSISTYGNWGAQQNYKAFEVFFYFLKEARPKRILEIGTSIGGFTSFLNYSCKELGIECDILSLDINEFPWYEEMKQSGIDIRIENVFSPQYDSVSQYIIDFIQSDDTTIVLCDGGNKKLEFNILSNYLKENDFILGHDYSYDKNYFEENINGKIWNWCELMENDILEPCKRNNLVDYRREVFQSVVWVCKMKTNNLIDVVNESTIIESNMVLNNEITPNNKVTFVTGLWNIKRDSLSDGWSRSFEHYLSKFEELLRSDVNLIIFGDAELESFVWERRNRDNTQFVIRNTEWFKSSVPYEKIQEIRNNPQWYGQSGWLPDSTQAKLEWYNPLVMSKMFLLHDAKILDKFDSDEMYWIDAGLSNTVHSGYFTHDKVQFKLKKYFNKFSFVCFPYEASNEIHGFSYPQINEYADSKVNLVGRGGFFGGPKESISEINSIYYSTLINTLNDGYMGTEESVFSIMVYKHSNLINYFEIEDNGLMGKFFEDLKNDTLEVKTKHTLPSGEPVKDISKTSLYVIGFNSPNQLKTLIQSMVEYDEDFIKKPKKYLLNNSTDRSTDSGYEELCAMYDFEIINPGENLGICGGRQYIAEHFDNTDSEFMFFFEDDMFFYPRKGEVCRNGFNRFVSNLYDKSLRIIQTENFDFLKLNFSEFFGDNSVQWSWYNVPQHIREEFWPQNTKLPQMGLDPNAPRTVFKNIKSLDGVPYVDGEIYYCNWPQIVSKKGNQKMFLDTKWAHAYEQTWMSFMYQETKKGNLNGSLLLMTPTEHNRFEHYEAGLRKES